MAKKIFMKIARYRYETVDRSFHICSTNWGNSWEVYRISDNLKIATVTNLRNAQYYVNKILNEPIDK